MKTKLKDNTIFRIIIISISLILCLFGRLFPPITGLSNDGTAVIFIFLGTIILWLTIGIDWPSLLCIFSLGLINTLGFANVFKTSFGNSTFVFLLFTFICTYALSKTSLIKRIAIWFINTKLAKKGGFYFITSFLTGVLLLGLFMSPSVLFVIILPILEEVFNIAHIEKEDRIGKILMLGLGFTISLSSGMTPIAHVFPLLAMEAAKINVSPVLYTALALPLGLIIFVLMLLMFKLFIKIDKSKLKDIDVSNLKNELPKIDKKDITILVIFILMILLWVVPSFFKNVSPEFYEIFNKFGTAMPPLIATIVLCIIRIDKKPLIEIGDAFKNGVPWASLVMCAATLALGSALTNEQIGIKAFLENNASSALKSIPEIALLIIFVIWAALQTNLSSNMVTATLVATVAASVLTTVNTSLNINTIICLIGMMASLAFATPPSMPHIAIISSSGYATTKDTLIYGGLLMLLSIIILVGIGYPLGMLFL